MKGPDHDEEEDVVRAIAERARSLRLELTKRGQPMTTRHALSGDTFWDEPMAPDELERMRREMLAELDGPEGQEMLAFMEWFKRRYPAPLARLRFATKQYRQSMRTRERATKVR